jgi:hypothetical protein
VVTTLKEKSKFFLRMMKLTLYPNNYFEWAREFVVFSSKVNASLALNLDQEDDLGLDHHLEGYPRDYILGTIVQKVDSSAEVKASASPDTDPVPEALARSEGLVGLIMAHPPGNSMADKLKFMVFEKMAKERLDKERIILALLDSLSLDSKWLLRHTRTFKDSRRPSI